MFFRLKVDRGIYQTLHQALLGAWPEGAKSVSNSQVGICLEGLRRKMRGSIAPELTAPDPTQAVNSDFCVTVLKLPRMAKILAPIGCFASAILISSTYQGVSALWTVVAVVVMTAGFWVFCLPFLKVALMDHCATEPLIWMGKEGLSIAGLGTVPWANLTNIEPHFDTGRSMIPFETAGRFEFNTSRGTQVFRISSTSRLNGSIEEIRERAPSYGAILGPLNKRDQSLMRYRNLRRNYYANR